MWDGHNSITGTAWIPRPPESRDRLGFEIAWLEPGKDIGAVARGRMAIFFRKRGFPFEPAVHWVFAEDIYGLYTELQASGANVVEPLN